MSDDFVDGLFAERESRKMADSVANGKRPFPANGKAATLPEGSTGTAYGLRALEDQCHEMANTPEGQRNHFLNVSAVKIAGLVAAGELNEETARYCLAEAAEACGLRPDEIRKTIDSGFRYGLNHPREIERQPEWYERSTAASVGTNGAVTAFGGETPASGIGTAADATRLVHEQLPLIDWHALWADEREEEWIVEPLLPARRIVALYSAPKVGKSILMLELAVAIARGSMVLGYKVSPPRRVLYVDFENDPRGDIRERLRNMDLEPGDLANLCYLSFPVLAGLDSEKGAAQLAAAMRAYRCEVVVIDTVSRAVGGEENENDTWLAFYRHTGLTIKQNEWACIRLDHSGKDETKGQRGGSAKVGDVDAVWRMSRASENVFSLTCEYNRLPIHEKELTIERLDEPLRHVVRPSAVRDRLNAEDAEMVQILNEAGAPLDVPLREAAKILKASRRRKATAWDRLGRILEARKPGGMSYMPVPKSPGTRSSTDDAGNAQEHERNDD